MKKINKNKKTKGQSLVEYGLILALVSVVVITIFQNFGKQIKTNIGSITSRVQQANQVAQTPST